MTGPSEAVAGADRRYCGQCGLALDDAHPECAHPECAARAELEPPRFCRVCARRMVVQVDPVGWRARCSRHGETSG